VVAGVLDLGSILVFVSSSGSVLTAAPSDLVELVSRPTDALSHDFKVDLTTA